MPVFSRQGFDFNQLLADAGLLEEPAPEGVGRIRSVAAMQYGYRQQVAQEDTPLFAYFYDSEEAEQYLDFFPYTTTRELRQVAIEEGMDAADLVSMEDGQTPAQMTPQQVEDFIRVLFAYVGEDMRDISTVVTELEDGDNPQVFMRGPRSGWRWVHRTSDYDPELLEDMLYAARENAIQMY